jgi:hypothetical protein
MWKVWAQLRLFFHCAKFHETEQALNKLGASSAQNFIHIGRKIHKIREKIHSSPQIRRGFSPQ